MKYQNAKDVLPPALLQEVQRYAAGQLLYIPSAEKPKSWGESSGVREKLLRRNRMILAMYRNGCTISELADFCYLSVDSIKKIVYGNRQTFPSFASNFESAAEYSEAGLAEEWLQLQLHTMKQPFLQLEEVFVAAIVRIPLRLIRTAGTSSDNCPSDPSMPLIVHYQDRCFHVKWQTDLLAFLRAQLHNAHPSFIIVPKECYADYMLHYGKYFQSIIF